MASSRPKYQVFISSTFEDLHEAREAVTFEVLAARQIPAGMENFPASDDRGWRTITRVIDQSDYYLLIVAGRYGTIDQESGLSWTEKEYDYAHEKGIPTIAFIRLTENITANQFDTDPVKLGLLRSFIAKISANHHRLMWSNIDDLRAKVAQALMNQIQVDEDEGNQRLGWYRGDQIPSQDSIEEFARLSSENAKLNERIQQLVGQNDISLKIELVTDPETIDNEINLKYFDLKDDRGATPADPLARWAKIGMMGNEVSYKEYSDWIDTANRTIWIKPNISNLGKSVSNNLVIDIEIDTVKTIKLKEDRKPSKSMIYVPDLRDLHTQNRIMHVYIEDKKIVNHKGFIRQRMKSIAPGITEPLVPFLIEIPLFPKPELIIHVKIHVVDDFGNIADICSDITLMHSQTLPISLKDLDS